MTISWMSTSPKLLKAVRIAQDHRKWFIEHGGSRAGYEARYGTYGDGWLAIYKADLNALNAAEAEVKRLTDLAAKRVVS